MGTIDEKPVISNYIAVNQMWTLRWLWSNMIDQKVPERLYMYSYKFIYLLLLVVPKESKAYNTTHYNMIIPVNIQQSFK